MRKILLICLVLVFGVSANATADLIFEYSGVFSGTTTPGGTPPWLTATFSQVDTDTVRLTLDTTGLIDPEFIDGLGWYFNFDDSKDVTALVFSWQSGNDADDINLGQNAFKADGDGFYDIQLTWDAGASKRLWFDSVVVYQISYAGGLSVDDFDYLSEPAGGWGPYKSAAHVQGIDEGRYSTWVYPGEGAPPPPPVPEPSTIMLIGAGLLGLGLLRKK